MFHLRALLSVCLFLLYFHLLLFLSKFNDDDDDDDGVMVDVCYSCAAGDVLSSVPYCWFILLTFGIFVAADVLASRR